MHPPIPGPFARAVPALAWPLLPPEGPAHAADPAVTQGTFTIADFTYEDGSKKDLTQQDYTLGTPRRGSDYINREYPLLDFVRTADVE